MVRKVCENLERKRELLYSFSTVVFIPVLYYCAVTYAFTPSTPFPKINKEGDHGIEGGVGGGGGDFVQESLGGQGDTGTDGSLRDAINRTFDGDILNFIRKRRELPYESVFYIVLLEVVKLFIVLTIYPGNHLFDQTPPLSWVWRGKTGTSPNSSYAAGQAGRAAQGRLPFSKRDKENGPGKSPSLQIKVLVYLAPALLCSVSSSYPSIVHSLCCTNKSLAIALHCMNDERLIRSFNFFCRFWSSAREYAIMLAPVLFVIYL